MKRRKILDFGQGKKIISEDFTLPSPKFLKRDIEIIEREGKRKKKK